MSSNLDLDFKRFFRELATRLSGEEQAIYIISPTPLEELQLRISDVDMVSEETAHACQSAFHYIHGALCITVSHAKDVNEADRLLRLILQNLGVMFVRVYV